MTPSGAKSDWHTHRKGERWYAVVYEGLDPVTGKERRRWHPAGSTREQAEELAVRLAAELNGRNDEVRSLTFAAYLTKTWLAGRRINLAESTWGGYRRKIDRHIIPALGHLRLRRLRAHHLETLYDQMLHPTNGRKALAPKTVLEVHLIIRGALNDAVKRGLVNRNVALVAHAPKLRSIPKVEPQAWNAQQLQAFLQAAAGHPLFPAFWVLAATGMRRSELLGLRWDDVDLKKARVSVNRGLVAVAYELRESRGKTRNSRRAIDLDPTTVKVLKAWRECLWIAPRDGPSVRRSVSAHGPWRGRPRRMRIKRSTTRCCGLSRFTPQKNRRTHDLSRLVVRQSNGGPYGSSSACSAAASHSWRPASCRGETTARATGEPTS
jgi:integrase